MKTKALCLSLIALLASNFVAYPMATEQVGPDRDHPTVSQPEWPDGIVALPRHPSRVYSIWVNGSENFYFNADLAQLNQLLDLFSKARLHDHEVWLKTGQPQVQTFGKQSVAYNANLHILAGLARAMNPREPGDTQDPRLTLYLGPDIQANQLVFPHNLIVHSEIEGLVLTNQPTKSVRQLWHGHVEFEGDTPDPIRQPGIVIQVSLWERGLPQPIKLAKVDRDGWFAANFSDVELANLKSGASWITITVGNWLTTPKTNDTIFPFQKLGDRTTAGTVKLPPPAFYYGRILFDDGTPPKLDPPPWSGARIMVDFSYAGSVEPDSQGYFKLFLTEEQFAKMTSDTPRKNIYVPDPIKTGQSTARFTFPPDLLSHDKTNAGTVQIPRP